MQDAASALLEFHRFCAAELGAADGPASGAAERIAGLEPHERLDLLAALGVARSLLDRQSSTFSIRPFRVGDLAMIAARQSILYAAQQGWGRGLEINEGETTTGFLRDFKPDREQCWIAEVRGAMAGSILLTDEGQGLARLRLFYVEPWAQGRGVGSALADACIGFARQAGYHAVTLWTHGVLEGARRIYAAKGFHLVDSAIHHTFGEPVQGETWRLELRRPDDG